MAKFNYDERKLLMSLIKKIKEQSYDIARSLGDKNYKKIQKIQLYKKEVKDFDEASKDFVQRNLVNLGKISRSAIRDATYAETFFTKKELGSLLSRHVNEALENGFLRKPRHKKPKEVVQNSTNKILETLIKNKDICPSYYLAGVKYYTSRDLVDAEISIKNVTKEIAQDKKTFLTKTQIEKGQKLYDDYLKDQGFAPLDDHIKGIETVLKSKQRLKIVDGAPGCGKTSIPMGYLAGLMKKGKQSETIEVITTAPTQKAAGGLKQSISEFVSFAQTKTNKKVIIKAMSLDNLIKRLEKGNVNKNAVVMMDEAGMLGTRTMSKFLENTNNNKIDSFLIGDASQIKPSTAGHGFRQVVLEAQKNEINMVKLSVNLRQKAKGEKVAAKNFREGSATQAIEYYENKRYPGDKPALVFSGNAKKTLIRTANQYVDWRRANPDKKDAVVLSESEKTANRVNKLIRKKLKYEGVILRDKNIKLNDNEEKNIAINDRIIFKKDTKTANFPNSKIQAGTSGKVIGFSKSKIKLELEDKSHVSITNKRVGNIDYSYALSLKEAQGVTKDAAFVAITSKIDRAEALVAFTRHKTQVITNVSTDAYKDKNELIKSLTPHTKKAIISDYSKPMSAPPSRYSYATKIRKHILKEIINEKRQR